MTDPSLDRRVADMLHRERDARRAGDLPGPAIAPASLYHLPGEPDGPYQYGRWSNPTWTELEAALGALQDAETLVFPSGMAAIAAALIPNLAPGDRLLLPSDGYGAVRALAAERLAPMGVEVQTLPTPEFDAADLEGVRLVWAETPSNPGLDVCDLAGLAARARAAGARLMVDNTTPTPLGQRPLDLGADLVVSADTKAVAGHSDVLAGHVASRDPDLIAKARAWRTLGGAILGPFEAYLAHRGLETLEIRLERMEANARQVAERLAAHPKVARLRYPGLPDDPAHRVARRQMTRFGPLVGATFADASAAERFISACRYLRPATSFGGVHSSAERRARWGDAVAPGFVRISIGCEPTAPFLDAIDDALDAV